jgi:hypothetical protein
MPSVDLTNPYNRIKIFVQSYQKNPFAVQVGLKLVLDTEETFLFAFVNIPNEELKDDTLQVVRKKPKWYVRQAMKQLKKDIKDWVELVTKGPSIVGEEVEIDSDFFK